MKKLKIIIVLVLFITLCCVVVAIDRTFPRGAFKDIEPGLLVWSSYDFTSTKSISGIHTSNTERFYIYDYMNSEEYIGLSFPYQYGETTYYTTKIKDTNEDCIIARTAGELSFVLSKQGIITYKKIYNNQLYYIFNNQIRRLDLITGNDVEIGNNVAPTYGFDINSVGEILYTSDTNNSLMLMNTDMMSITNICEGKAAKFIDDDNIVFSDSDKICRLELRSQNKSIIKKNVNCIYILLNPSKTHIIYIDMTPTKDGGDMFAYEVLYIMLLNGKKHNIIRGGPPFSYGIEWIDFFTEYYEKNTINMFSGYHW